MAARGRMRRARCFPFHTNVLLIVAADAFLNLRAPEREREGACAIVEGVAFLTAYGVTVNDPTMP